MLRLRTDRPLGSLLWLVIDEKHLELGFPGREKGGARLSPGSQVIRSPSNVPRRRSSLARSCRRFKVLSVAWLSDVPGILFVFATALLGIEIGSWLRQLLEGSKDIDFWNSDHSSTKSFALLPAAFDFLQQLQPSLPDHQPHSSQGTRLKHLSRKLQLLASSLVMSMFSRAERPTPGGIL
jgi:hypothetical protein